MNADLPKTPRDELEVRLTALLLGELPPEEAAAVRQAVEQDPELAKLHERLKQTIGWVRQAQAGTENETTAPAPPLRLSPLKRQRLLAHFQTREAVAGARIGRLPWYVPMALAAVLVFMAALVGLEPAGLQFGCSSHLAQQQGREWFMVAQKAPPLTTETEAVRPLAPPAANGSSMVAQSGGSSVGGGEVGGGRAYGGMGARGGMPGGTPWPAIRAADEKTKLGVGFGLMKTDRQAAPQPAEPSAKPAEAAEQSLKRNVQAGNMVVGESVNAPAPAITVAPRPSSRTSGMLRSEVAPAPATTAAPVPATPPSAGPPAASPTVPAQSTLGYSGSYSSLSQMSTIYSDNSQPGRAGSAATPSRRRSGGEVTREKLSERGLSEAKEEAAPAQRERYGFPPQSQPGATEGTVRLNVWDRDADGAALAREAPVDALSKQIPLLRDLPALGGLFRNEARGKDVSGPPGESEIYLGKKPLTPPTQPLFEEGHLRDKAAEPEIASRPLDSLILHPGLTVTGPEAEGRARLLSRGDESKMAAKKKPLTDEAQIQKRLEPAAEPAPAAAASNRRPPPPPPPEVLARDNAFSTFSLNVSDVSFKLAGASLEQGHMPDPAAIRSEEFINALDYRDPQPPPGAPVAFAYEIARDPFAQNRDLVRFAVKTAARGREAGRALNLVLLLDTSGSMERADRVRIVQEALRVLAAQLRPADRVSVVTFARTARLWADAIPGNQAAEVLRQVGGIPPEGGTNLEEAMNLAYQTASRHFLSQGANRVVLLTDGAANLGDVDPGALQRQVESYRKKGLALDCFGIGWEGYNDDLLEVLSSHGDGRYGFLNAPEETATEFAGQLAGALQVAAADVKVQVEFNPARVIAYRQVGYAKHQLAKEQFRDNTVDAAEIGAAEAGNALYVVQVNPQGQGPLATVRIRYRVPATGEYREQSWPAPYTGAAAPLEQASPALRLAAVAAAFSEWLAGSPYAGEVTPDRLLGYLRDVPAVFSPDPRPQRLEWMVRQAKAIAGR